MQQQSYAEVQPKPAVGMKWPSFVLAEVCSSDYKFFPSKNITSKRLADLTTYLQSPARALPPASLLRGLCKALSLLIQHKLSYSEGWVKLQDFKLASSDQSSQFKL